MILRWFQGNKALLWIACLWEVEVILWLDIFNKYYLESGRNEGRLKLLLVRKLQSPSSGSDGECSRLKNGCQRQQILIPGIWNCLCRKILDMKKPIRLRTLSWLCVYASLCPALYGLTNCSPPGSSAHQAPPLAWNFPGKNTGVDCHFLLQGIFPTQRSNSCLLHLLCWQACSLPLVPPGVSPLVAQTVKNLPAMWETWFDPWVRKIPQRREWLPITVFLPGESHGQRSLAGCSPWGRKELDMTEQLTLVLPGKPVEMGP